MAYNNINKEELQEGLELLKYFLDYWKYKLYGGDNVAEKVAKVGVTKESGYLYFVDKDGDVSRAKMARGRGKN